MPSIEGFIVEARKFALVLKQRNRTRRGSARSDGRPYCHAACINGWTKLGSGYYGEAWAHRDYPGLVCKVSGPQGWGYGQSTVRSSLEDYGYRADAWAAFAELCLTHRNVHLPEVYHFERLSRGVQFACMKRYEAYWGGSSFAGLQKVKDILTGETDCTLPWLRPLINVAARDNVRCDLHEQNVMWDAQMQTWVIIDPFSSNGSTCPAIVQNGRA